MALRPPRHSIDAEMVYISQYDPAWDNEKIKSERAALKQGETHPFDLWRAGETRFDAKTVPTEYLREDEEPTRFYIRRMSDNLAAVLIDQSSSVMGETRAALDSFRYGVKRIDGLELGSISIDWPGEDSRKSLSVGDIEALERVGVSRQVRVDVGAAALQANWPLKAAEKKHSGS